MPRIALRVWLPFDGFSAVASTRDFVKKADGVRLDEMARHHAMRLNGRVLVKRRVL
jgi:hypothetical protein